LKGKRRTGQLFAGAIAAGRIKTEQMEHSGVSCLRTTAEGELYRNVMNIHYLFCLLSVVLVTGCTDSPGTAAVAATAVPTPTPENYALYTDQDLQIYAQTIDLKIQQALKNNDANQAQELGRKRQELIAEFDRRHLKRMTVVSSGHPYRHKPVSTPSPPQSHPPTPSGNGLPGEN
jgi:hypothetical protein